MVNLIVIVTMMTIMTMMIKPHLTCFIVGVLTTRPVTIKMIHYFFILHMGKLGGKNGKKWKTKLKLKF
jgi:hypothetical protein